jgi:hypothetical protein
MVNSPKVDYLWQTVFPEIAYEHSYVMQGLLSLAALHVAYLHPAGRRTHLHIAAHHHTLALSGLREDMNSICPENADAVFASATLMFLYAFTTFSKLSDEIEEDGADTGVRKSRILGADWIPLVHGVHVVIGPTYEYLQAGPLRSTLSVQHWDDVDPDVHPAPDDAHILKIKETWQDDDNKEVYDRTLHMLRKASASISHFQSLPDDAQDEWGYNRDWSAVSVPQSERGCDEICSNNGSRSYGSRSYRKSTSNCSANDSRWLCLFSRTLVRCFRNSIGIGGPIVVGKASLVSLTIVWVCTGLSG